MKSDNKFAIKRGTHGLGLFTNVAFKKGELEKHNVRLNEMINEAKSFVDWLEF